MTTMRYHGMVIRPPSEADSYILQVTNHASNYLPLAGTLSRDKARLLSTVDEALSLGPSVLRPEAWRAL
jgi:hypothetical protein